MHPRDLLSLARTTKNFRAFLMSRKTSVLSWKASRANVEGLPDCPEFLSEPAYANLAFSAVCHVSVCSVGRWRVGPSRSLGDRRPFRVLFEHEVLERSL